MSEFNEIMTKAGWFYQGGPENDVVLSTRVRIARNLNDYPFPGALSQKEEKTVHTKIITAFGKLPESSNFTILYLDELKPVEKKVLLERCIITRNYCETGNRIVALCNDGEVSGMICEEDHLRLSCIKGGLVLDEAFNRINEIDGLLENHLQYAVNIEWGYLTAGFSNLGTGMRVSVLIHLPALELASLLDETLNLIVKKGFCVKSFGDLWNHSPGTIFQISNRFSIGYKEEEIINYINELLVPLISLERKTREALYMNKKREIGVKVKKALAILRYCRMIPLKEAIEALSLIRMGICMDLVDEVTLEAVTALFFLIQESHIEKMSNVGINGNAEISDTLRANIIRDIL
ncbi:MAG: hypothetical protein JW881_12245 [Spirochaetales bacterium]|nr:hypothetical protein [Spirochaetales bacterium]